MGLNSTWDDSAAANPHVPALNETFSYGKQPIRGVSLGGWLSLEPWITPSLFNYSLSDGVVDEWHLMQHLGSKANTTLERHYATFVTQDTIAQIRDAGFDHVRIPFSYWAVRTYPGDPYLAHTSWRYLLRAIEWCRHAGLRVSLDLHAVPGSQNGWNHSGHQGSIGWLNGTEGARNGDRALDIHRSLATFFAQPRYRNVLAIYGLVNEPFMLHMNATAVLDWNRRAVGLVRAAGLAWPWITFGDGFLVLSKWKTMMQDVDDRLLLDTHQYTILNNGQIGLTHQARIDIVCNTTGGGWVQLISDSVTKGKG